MLNQKDLLESYYQEMQARLALGEAIFLELQQKYGEYVKFLTVIALVGLPPTTHPWAM
jgi:hypothetical protein